MAAGSKSAVVLAVAGNGFLTVAKFVAFLLSGSGAMMSEAIHSFADTANQVLLMVGIGRSDRPATAAFHYGFGAERFFFALMSAVGIFILGAGVTVYHGVHTLLHPGELNVGWLDYSVLALAFIVEMYVLLQAVKVANTERGEKPLMAFLRESSDPTLAAVLLEDGVACLGVLIAASGMLAAQLTGNPLFDSLATLTIGLLLGLVAVWLGYKNRGLILGRAIPVEVQEEVHSYLMAQPSVESVNAVKTRIVGAGNFKYKAEIDWDGAFLGEQCADWVGEQASTLGTPQGAKAFARSFGAKMTQALALEIDRMEGELRQRHPQLQHLDFESDPGRDVPPGAGGPIG